jgi:transposase
MELVHPRCAGLDVSKRDAKVCVRLAGSGRAGARSTVSTWGAVTNQVLALREHLVAQRVTLVVMEATGDYWKPFYYLLEDAPFEVMLVNARHVKNLPGRKSDLLTELPGRCGSRDVRGRVGLARFPRRDQRWRCPAGAVRVGGAADWVA